MALCGVCGKNAGYMYSICTSCKADRDHPKPKGIPTEPKHVLSIEWFHRRALLHLLKVLAYFGVSLLGTLLSIEMNIWAQRFHSWQAHLVDQIFWCTGVASTLCLIVSGFGLLFWCTGYRRARQELDKYSDNLSLYFTFHSLVVGSQ